MKEVMIILIEGLKNNPFANGFEGGVVRVSLPLVSPHPGLKNISLAAPCVGPTRLDACPNTYDRIMINLSFSTVQTYWLAYTSKKCRPGWLVFVSYILT